MRVTKIELVLITLSFLGIGFFLATFAGGPIYSDELSHMDAGLNNLKIPYNLNRYTHIFLQKPFLELSLNSIKWSKNLLVLCAHVDWLPNLLVCAHSQSE